jgi:hypothetical protein
MHWQCQNYSVCAGAPNKSAYAALQGSPARVVGVPWQCMRVLMYSRVRQTKCNARSVPAFPRRFSFGWIQPHALATQQQHSRAAPSSPHSCSLPGSPRQTAACRRLPPPPASRLAHTPARVQQALGATARPRRAQGAAAEARCPQAPEPPGPQAPQLPRRPTAAPGPTAAHYIHLSVPNSVSRNSLRAGMYSGQASRSWWL